MEAVEAQWTQREIEVMKEREESRKLAALFQKVAINFPRYQILVLNYINKVSGFIEYDLKHPILFY